MDVNVNLIDCISEITNRSICMDGESYLYLADFSEVNESVIVEAKELKLIKEQEYTELEAKKQRDKLMLDGEVYTLNGVEYKVSLTKDDGDGLVQVKSSFELGLSETVIYFNNGTKMPIKATEFNEFALWFVTNRSAYFK